MPQRRYVVENFHEYNPHQAGGIPEDWEVWNASRPLYGEITWQGEFLCGVFYAALDPNDPYCQERRKRNQELDGYLITYVGKDIINEYGLARCEEYGIDPERFSYDDFVRSWLNNQRREDEVS